MRAIDADLCESYFWEHLDDNGMAAAMNAINDMPTIEPEIVRCKDCKHKGTKNCVANAWTTIFGVMVKDDFYCGLAERRTDE